MFCLHSGVLWVIQCYWQESGRNCKTEPWIRHLFIALFSSEHSIDYFSSERFSCDIVAFFTTVFKRSLYQSLFLRNFNQVNLDFISRMRQHKQHPSKQQSFPSAFSLFCDYAMYVVVCLGKIAIFCSFHL